MESFFDEYEHYNFDKNAANISNSRKGRTKKEASMNTNRFNPGGHERKMVVKLQNTERKRKEKNRKKSE